MVRMHSHSLTVFAEFLPPSSGKQAESARADAAEKAMKEQMEQRQKLEKVGVHNRAAEDCGVDVFLDISIKVVWVFSGILAFLNLYYVSLCIYVFFVFTII